MPHIKLNENEPGIRSLVMFRPETGKYLYQLVQVLLRGTSPLSEGERELIAAYVSAKNNCAFCTNSHAAAAQCFLPEFKVAEVFGDTNSEKLSGKMKTLLNIASKTQQGGKFVTEEDIFLAREAGATDADIHDTVLIAAVFSMFNRYVDGLDTTVPKNPEDYLAMGKRMAEKGYVLP